VSEMADSGSDTVWSSVNYTLGANLENLTLAGTGNINASGNGLNNVIIGNSGRNTISAGTGDDVISMLYGAAAIKPTSGTDHVDGGAGNDVLLLAGVRSDYYVLSSGGHDYLVGSNAAVDVTNVEYGAFFQAAGQAWAGLVSSLTAFDGLSYIASYEDLRTTLGTNAQAGVDSFLHSGFEEGRTITFNALDYIASYLDLRLAFGADAHAGAEHYIQYGATESRTVTFDGWEYLAANTDLISSIGADETAAARHYIETGANEHRATTFDAAAYAAANPDLLAAFGNDADALARHYVMFGYAEHRDTGVSMAAADTGSAHVTGFVDTAMHNEAIYHPTVIANDTDPVGTDYDHQFKGFMSKYAIDYYA